MSLIFDPPPEDTGISFTGPTCLEYALYAFLEEQGIEFIPEWPIIGYRLDAFDPLTKIGYEADGYPTHFTIQGKNRDALRDKRILATGEVNQILRFGYEDLIYWL